MFAFLKPRPLVSICVPAYRAEDFIAETVQSALDQTVQNIEIVISNDGAHATPSLTQFRHHPKISVYQSRTRRGWVGNSNFVLSRARGRHVMILPHDDVLRPNYLERCLDVLEAHPQAFAAYSDLETNLAARVLRASEVHGPLEARVSKVLKHLHNGYSYRALMRWTNPAVRRLRLLPNPPNDMFVDTTFILQQALHGELHRIPEPLYFKRFHSDNTHRNWWTLPTDELCAGWHNHCRQMSGIASGAVSDQAKIEDLIRHRMDARNVREAPSKLKQAMAQHQKAG